MVTVYKYVIQGLFLKYDFDIPSGAKIIDVAHQNNKIIFWALVDTDKPTEKRFFYAATTGDKIKGFSIEKLIPVGTFLSSTGSVVHVFEVK